VRRLAFGLFFLHRRAALHRVRHLPADGWLRARGDQLFCSQRCIPPLPTYPFEPRWIAPRRWLRSVLYGTAAVAAPIVWVEGRFGIPFFAMAQIGFLLMVAVTIFARRWR
jgi:hypothetical protein